MPRQVAPLQRSLSSTLLPDTAGLVLSAATAGTGLGRVVVVGTVVVVVVVVVVAGVVLTV